MTKLLLIMLAGGLGSGLRYGMGGLVHRYLPASYPWGTLTVNLTGCFLFGLLWALAEGRWSISPEMRAIILIGFLGGFTTFSSFAFETTQFLRDGQWLFAGMNVVMQNGLGILLLYAGITLGRR